MRSELKYSVGGGRWRGKGGGNPPPVTPNKAHCGDLDINDHHQCAASRAASQPRHGNRWDIRASSRRASSRRDHRRESVRAVRASSRRDHRRESVRAVRASSRRASSRRDHRRESEQRENLRPRRASSRRRPCRHPRDLRAASPHECCSHTASSIYRRSCPTSHGHSSWTSVFGLSQAAFHWWFSLTVFASSLAIL